MIKNHKIDRKERLSIDLGLRFPSPHKNKSYVDERRYYTIKVDVEEPIRIVEEGVVDLKLRLRALVVVKKMFGNKVDSSFTYRVGENFALLRINITTLRISYSFSKDNILDILDNGSHILQSRILETTTLSRDE